MIKEKNKKLIFFCSLFVFLVLLFFLMPLSKFSLATVFALENDYPSFFGLTITNDTSIIEYAKYFFNLAMAVGGFLALTTMVFGGLYYLISFAGGKFIGEGTAWIKAGASGLIILLSSYLIVYSINPDLVYFRLEDLIPFFSKFQPNGKEEKKIPITFYNEIPLGVITENLVSRTRDCYDFDPEGNPIEGEKVTIAAKVIGLPTYLDKDRVDCLLKLED
ncbi:MAG: hypothetical protein HYT36_01320 [Candidatus Staskawiczbacteria bacterium]|nr:hypothetical protein [Candidatus Staskawiczbacteria bacterium]